MEFFLGKCLEEVYGQFSKNYLEEMILDSRTGEFKTNKFYHFHIISTKWQSLTKNLLIDLPNLRL